MTNHLPPARGRHNLRFSYSQWYPQWEAVTELSDSPFGKGTLQIKVHGDTAWEPITDDELALIDNVLDWLPDILPVVTSKLRAWDESLSDAKLFRETFTQPSISLFERDEHPRRSWAFVVERLAFEGDNWGVHLEFFEDQFREIWAGD